MNHNRCGVRDLGRGIGKPDRGRPLPQDRNSVAPAVAAETGRSSHQAGASNTETPPGTSTLTAVDRQNEIAAIFALALPADVSTVVARRMAADLRLIVAALPPLASHAADRAMSRDLLAAAQALEVHW